MADELTQAQNQAAEAAKKLTAEHKKTEQASGNMTAAMGALYTTVSNAKANLDQPMRQAGKAASDVANVFKEGVKKLGLGGGMIEGFVDVVAKGATIMGSHQQKLLDFGNGLAGATSLSIKSFSELHDVAATANVGLDDFTNVQKKASLFLAEMGGQARGASGQMKLFADITNRTNDDFEKLGQMGLSVAEKQSLMGDSMDMMRSIGLAAGTDSAQASAIVSGAMQNMAMEANKMAALTGKDRRETLENMAKKAKSDTNVLVTAELMAKQNGHTAEQVAQNRTALAAYKTQMEAMGPAGDKVNQAMDLAARSGVSFEVAMGQVDKQLLAMISKNPEFMDAQNAMVKKMKAGEKVDVNQIADSVKKFAGGINEGAINALAGVKGNEDLINGIMMFEINARKLATKTAEGVEEETKKHANTAMGQAQNMSQAAKDTVTAMNNIADSLLTVGVEVFNDQFADDMKDVRDKIKDIGTFSTGAAKNLRDDLIGVHEYGSETNQQMRIYLASGLSHEEARMQISRDLLAEQMTLAGFSTNAVNAVQGYIGTSQEQINAQTQKQKDAYSESGKAIDAMQASLSGAKAMTSGELQTMADALGVNVDALTAQATKMGITITDASGLTKEGAAVASDTATRYDALNAAQKKNFDEVVSKLGAGRKMADAQYDQLIQNIINSKEVQLSDDTKGLFSKIAGSDQSSAIVDLLKKGIQVNTGDTENDRLATSIDELVKVLKGQAGKSPNVIVSKSPEEMSMWEDMKKSWNQIKEDLSN